jgi:hypothetical protein
VTLFSPARTCLFAVAAFALGLTPARALLNIDGQRNQLFVFGSVTFGYDSNIFADANATSDYTVNTVLGAELKRKAGIIAVNATGTLAYAAYGSHSDENSFNPKFAIDFNKTTGRTTGQLAISAFRESRSDSAVNLRTNSWNFPVALTLKYPVNDKYYLASQTTYLRRRYVETTALANYTDYSQSLDVFYVYTSKLDLVGGYRIRVSRTSFGNDSYDHWFNVGATGGLFAKLNGTIRLGYQLRDVSGAAGENYTHLNALVGVTWPVTRKLNLGAQIARDFNTIATGASVDSLSAAVNATYAMTRKLEFNSGIAYGQNRFLGSPPPARRDTFVSFDAGARYRMNDHLQVGASYTYFKNWSTFDFSDFDRQGFSVDVSGHY